MSNSLLPGWTYTPAPKKTWVIKKGSTVTVFVDREFQVVADNEDEARLEAESAMLDSDRGLSEVYETSINLEEGIVS